MNVSLSMLDPLRMRLERLAALRAPVPPVALEVNGREIVLVRVKRRRRRFSLEAVQVRPMPEEACTPSISSPLIGATEEVASSLRKAFESTGTRPSRVSLVLPDNLAKVTLVSLPERPAGRRQLNELVRFKLRRTVPFRLEDAAISYQLLAGEGHAVSVLVVVMMRSLVEQYEKLLQGIGARPGLVGLSTCNLFNLYRGAMARAAEGGGDTALLNCTPEYFSLLIVRNEQLIFYRCKSYGAVDDAESTLNGSMYRELSTSLSYHQEKLGGRSVGCAYVRSVGRPQEQIVSMLSDLGIPHVEPLDLPGALAMPDAVKQDPSIRQKIAPAVGAAAGV